MRSPRRIARLLVAVVGASGALASNAQAMPIRDPGTYPSRPQAVTAELVTPDGFDWGAAGIGAGGSLLLLIGVGGSVAVVRHRSTPQRRTAEPR
jgi:hypothetical protein